MSISRVVLREGLVNLEEFLNFYELSSQRELRNLGGISFPIGQDFYLNVDVKIRGYLNSGVRLSCYKKTHIEPFIDVWFSRNHIAGYLYFRCNEMITGFNAIPLNDGNYLHETAQNNLDIIQLREFIEKLQKILNKS
ncbi:MAG: hypothetical protein KatS3mg001_599 [Candidatus Pacearchaeota archaeon]|nr:MAG: hypothetical protein KatS3mg001_599 [Candidatus Pacearchaeota archaeon]